MDLQKKRIYDLNDVARQIVYLFYKNPDELLDTIKTRLNKLVDTGVLIYDEDYKGFSGNEFNPVDEIEVLQEEFKKDISFKNDCIRQYQPHQWKNVQKQLELKNGNFDTDTENYKELNDYLQEFENSFKTDARAGIRTDYLFDARDNILPFDLLMLLISIKSIIGHKNYVRTYKNIILQRMFGCKTKAIYQNYCNNFSKEFDYLKKRYQFDKLMNEAIQRGFLLKIPAGRGFYIATKYKKIGDFTKKIKNHIDNSRKKKDEEKQAAREILNYKNKPHVRSIEDVIKGTS